MLPQATTSNGYSWWWASHIRTKQSKWLEQNIQEMEGKVEHVLNLIKKDGDSFAKRAEMYYKHRPELISFVEESVRAYRSLAERYDKLSTDLQKANTTIASICPEKVAYDYEEDDDIIDGPTKTPKNTRQNTTKIPKTPKLPSKDTKGVLKNASKTIQETKNIKENPSSDVSESGLTIDEALEEMEKLQKEILGMQTVKESMKSAYEDSLAQYWDTESKILENQQRICSLQNEFQASQLSESDDDQISKAEAALKSCEETLDALQEKQEKLGKDAELQQQTFNEAIQKLKSLKHECNLDQSETESNSNVSTQVDEKEIKESFEGLSKNPLTVTELAETIDKLMNKMVSLETTVSSQTSLNETLRKQADDLQTQIRNLENDKAAFMNFAKPRESDVGKKEINNKDDITLTSIEQKLRMNLEFWLKISSVFQQIHEFKTRVEDLQEEVKKVKAKGLAGKSSTSLFTTDLRSDIRPIYKHLIEINNKITGWIELSTMLKDELQIRCSSLSKIQEEIKFSTHNAEKFQGKISKMEKENNEVNEELEAGLNHANSLKLEVGKTLLRLEKEFGFSDDKSQPPKKKSSGRSVSSCLFGGKSKKQKPSLSLFSCLRHPKKFLM